MDTVDIFLNGVDLADGGDIEQLLELASFARQLADGRRHDDISKLIRRTVESGCWEAFSWVIGILQEALENAGGAPGDFECPLGRSIPGYDELIARLQADNDAYKNGVETVCDKNGEVESFFNIITYRTGFKNIYLVSAENFDTKDNDFVQYKLVFLQS